MISKETCVLHVPYTVFYFYLRYEISATSESDAYTKLQMKAKLDEVKLKELDENVKFSFPSMNSLSTVQEELSTYGITVLVAIHTLDILKVNLIATDIKNKCVVSVENSEIDDLVGNYLNNYKERMLQMQKKLNSNVSEIHILSYSTKELNDPMVEFSSQENLKERIMKLTYNLRIKVKVELC